MPDFGGSPVATGVDVNPNKGLQTLSDLMGLQQKQIGISQAQQNLQTGQFVQQQQQAAAQQQQAAMSTRLAATKMAQSGQDPDGNPIRGDDGEIDPVKFSTALNKIDPVNAAPIVQNILKTTNDKLNVQSMGLKLDAQQRNMIAGPMQALNLDPSDDNITNARAAIGSLLTAHPEMAKNVASANGLLDQVSSNPDPAARKKMANSFSAHLQPGAAVETQPAGATADTGTNIVAGTVAPAAAGGGFTPATSLKKQIPPQIVTPPGGVPQPYAGGGGPIPSSYGGGGPAPTQTDVENFGRYQANLDNRVQVASDLIPRVQAAEHALDQIRGGGGAAARAAAAKNLQAIPGIPKSFVDAVAGGDLGSAQEAEKYLFQTTFAGLKQSMQGDPARVAEFNSAEGVFPNIGTDPRATKAVLGFMTDQANRDYAEQQALVTARKAGTVNPATWQADYQQKLRAGQVPGVPSGQVPTNASKAMPSGDRLTAYAAAHFGGDTTKARAYLGAHGYQ